MRDALAITSAATVLAARRTPFLVATVVRIEGSSYRRPGARLIATEEGRLAGSISGGCLERDLLRTGFWRTRAGPTLVRYDSRDPDEGEPVLGCGGVVDVLLERGIGGDDEGPLALVGSALAADTPVALATVFATSDPNLRLATRWTVDREGNFAGGAPQAFTAALTSAAATALESERAAAISLPTAGGSVDVLVEPVLPPPHLFVFGDGADVLPLVATARSLGWRASVWAPPASAGARSLVAAGATVEADLSVLRARIDAAASRGRAMAVIMGHGLARDREALGAVLDSRAGYVGVLGPRERAASLGPEGTDAWLADPRVHVPIGLDLGAETPEEIALSIASEILARIRGGSGENLRERATIHLDPP